jgi:hypothetical protein
VFGKYPILSIELRRLARYARDFNVRFLRILFVMRSCPVVFWLQASILSAILGTFFGTAWADRIYFYLILVFVGGIGIKYLYDLKTT